MQDFDWSSVHNVVGVGNKFNAFSQVIAELHDKYFPLVTIKNSNHNTQNKPWITSSILNSIKKRKIIYTNVI